jgi:uncharacterized membrane protein YecN with MAPEG domain
MPLPATSLLTGLFALMMVPLSVQVSLRRRQTGIAGMNTGGDETLRRRIRAHGNFAEYAPLAVLAVGLTEFGGAAPALVWALAAAMLFARVLHAVGMLFTSGPAARGAAMVVQHLAFAVAGVWLLRHTLARL